MSLSFVCIYKCSKNGIIILFAPIFVFNSGYFYLLINVSQQQFLMIKYCLVLHGRAIIHSANPHCWIFRSFPLYVCVWHGKPL